MKKIQQISRIIKLLILLPFEISSGHKKQAYRRIKKLMVSANLL